MTKKKILTFRFLLVPMMILAACAPTATEAPAVTQETIKTQETVVVEHPTEEPVQTEAPELEKKLTCTISIWHSFDEDEFMSLEGVLDTFQESNPDVQFDILYVPSDDMKSKFETSAGEGGGPTFLIGSAYWGPEFSDSLLITDVSQIANDEFLDTISPIALETVEYKDGLLGLPINMTGVLMFRNSNIILDAPTTLDELITAAQAATNGDIVGSYLDYGLFLSAGHLHALGGQLMDAEGNPTFNDEKSLEWIEMMRKFGEGGLIENNTDNDVNLFQEGRVGIIIDVLWNAENFAEAIGSENLEVDPWPADMSGYVQTDVIFLNANFASEDLNCSWTFLEFMYSTEAQELFSDQSMAGYIPTIEAAGADRFQRKVLDAFENGTPYPVIPEMGAYWEPLDTALFSTIEQGADPAEALQAAEDAVVERVEEIHGE
jgi:arabinogalactan oligomer/maltooligosaccharide transport system substrate-binding protein